MSIFSGLLGGGSKQQVVSNAPWQPQQDYLTYGFGQARNLYDQNRSLTPGFSQDSLNAFDMQRQRAMQGSPLNRSAQQGLQSTIQGDYLYGGPGFNAAFDAASRRILPQVNSVFSRAGRTGSGLAATAQTQALADAFAGQYGQERQNQMQAMGMAPQLAQQDYTDISALRDIGMAQEGMAQEQAMDPWKQLQLYQNSIGGNYGSQQTTPLHSNPLGGALGGAMAGGSMFGPWGAAAGGVLGLLGSR